MNPKLQKTINDIEQTNNKITKLQELLPALEKQKTELENFEFIRIIRSANITPGELSEFVDNYRAGLFKTTARTESGKSEQREIQDKQEKQETKEKQDKQDKQERPRPSASASVSASASASAAENSGKTNNEEEKLNANQ